MQTQVREDLLDHRLFEERCDDLQLAAAVRAMRHVDLEDPLEGARVRSQGQVLPVANLSPQNHPMARPLRIEFADAV